MCIKKIIQIYMKQNIPNATVASLISTYAVHSKNSWILRLKRTMNALICLCMCRLVYIYISQAL